MGVADAMQELVEARKALTLLAVPVPASPRTGAPSPRQSPAKRGERWRSAAERASGFTSSELSGAALARARRQARTRVEEAKAALTARSEAQIGAHESVHLTPQQRRAMGLCSCSRSDFRRFFEMTLAVAEAHKSYALEHVPDIREMMDELSQVLHLKAKDADAFEVFRHMMVVNSAEHGNHGSDAFLKSMAKIVGTEDMPGDSDVVMDDMKDIVAVFAGSSEEESLEQQRKKLRAKLLKMQWRTLRRRAESSCVDALKAELKAMKPRARRRYAEDVGATEDEIDDADESDNPKAALIKLAQSKVRARLDKAASEPNPQDALAEMVVDKELPLDEDEEKVEKGPSAAEGKTGGGLFDSMAGFAERRG